MIGEKIPLFALSAVSSVVTYLVQQSWGTMTKSWVIAPGLRIANALVSYVSYMTKTFFPKSLAVYYPFPEAGLPLWEPIVSLFVLAVITAAVICLAKRRYLVTGWLWYLGTLLPIIGLVQVGLQAMADRYTYLPLIGIFIMLAWGAGELAGRWRYGKVFAAIAMVAVSAVMLLNTRNQVMKWRNSVTLYEHTLEVTENNFIINTCYGNALYKSGRYEEALEQYHKALKIKPQLLVAKRNIGKVFLQQGKVEEAVDCFEQVLTVHKDWPDVYRYLGLACAQQGKYAAAIDNYNESLRLAPEQWRVLNEIGQVAYKLNRIDDAIKYWMDSISLNSNQFAVHNALGQSYFHQNEFDKAVKHWTDSLILEPGQPEVQSCVAAALTRQQKYDKAVEYFVEALREEPNLADAHKNLAAVLVYKGNTKEAINHYIEYLRIEPNQPLIHKTVAELLYQQGDLDRAITHYNHSLQIDCNQANVLRNLGHIYYLKDSIAKAVDCWHKALQISPDFVEAINDLAWVKATRAQSEFFDPDEAVNLALQACGLTEYNKADLLDTLAAAHAAGGDFSEAVKIAEKAITMALSNNQQDLAVQICKHLELFRQKAAYIERSD